MVRGNAKAKAQEKRLKKLEAERKAKGRGSKESARIKAAGIKVTCPECKASFPNMKIALEHFQAKHSKKPLPASFARYKEEMAEEMKRIAEQKKIEKKKKAEALKQIAAIRVVLTKFYTENAPDKLANIEKILGKYDGKWDKLEAGLQKSYGEKTPKLTEVAKAAIQ
mmetsp:Transcript_18163/g.44551  ORF Transcript_18163/g.44551 Transcript_18163/m.44551 type:complete len:167 (+) Transcript_18163:296-796(+)